MPLKFLSGDNQEQDQQEFNIRTKLESIRKELPEKVQNHLVKTFYIQDKTETSPYIYIFEILRPLNSYEQGILFTGMTIGTFLPKQVKKKFLQDITILTKEIENYFDNNIVFKKIDKIVPSFRELIFSFISENYLKEIIEQLDFSEFFVKGNLRKTRLASELTGIILSDIRKNKTFQKYDDFIQNKFNFDIDIKLNSVIYQEIKEYINFQDFTFPISREQYSQEQHQDKEINLEHKDFLEAMLYLSVYHNLDWNDLHQENIMVRPSTGDFVAADIGYFNFQGQTD